MDPNRESGFRVISLGTVVEDKPAGSFVIKARPDEHSSLDNGDITETSRQYNVDLPDAKGIPRPSTLTGGSVIEATWRPVGGGGNQMTAPDVVSGEAVVIYGYADTQDYYWDKHGSEPGLRRLEHVVTAFSNLRSGRTAFGPDSSYSMTWSTREKYVQLQTADNDGELAAYNILLNTGEGTLTIQDNLGNTLTLDSTKGKLTAEINEDIVLKTKRISLEASESVSVKTPKYDLNCETTTTEASGSSTITTPVHTEDATAVVTGGMQVTNKDGGPSGVLKGDFHLEGNLTASGTIMDGTGNSNHHEHPNYVEK